jgi:hypothetical protein
MFDIAHTLHQFKYHNIDETEIGMLTDGQASIAGGGAQHGRDLSL